MPRGPLPSRLPGTVLPGAVLLAAVCAATAALTACSDRAPDRAGQDAAAAAPKPSRWHQAGDGRDAVVAMDPEQQDELLAAAVAEARSTLEPARERWAAEQAADAAGHWSLKWAAPTATGTTEYLWVEPIRWSPFRVEGRLASAPREPLACGKGQDEPVQFPIEQVVDWVRYEGRGFSGMRQGGYTMDALARVFGEP